MFSPRKSSNPVFNRKGRRGFVFRSTLERLEGRAMFAVSPVPVPLDQTFLLSSLPSATKTIYLDFTGHRAEGAAAAAWGSATPIDTPPYSADADAAFSPAELATIQQVWARVAEDFSPFQVNVTTREPDVSALQNSGSGDVRWGIRVVLGDGASNPSNAAGGVALIGSFSAATDIPCFVNTAALASANPLFLENAIAIAATHEVGHTLGLQHDGVAGGDEYYGGHGGTGATSWGPIMGNPYNRNVTQWSRGQYAVANNREDDLSVMTRAVNGFGYRTDDHNESLARATRLTQSPGQAVLEATGIIERNTDADCFSFTVSAGRITLDVQPFDATPATPATFDGANLDVGAVLYDAGGRIIATLQPSNRLDVSYVGMLTGGTYFLRVFGTGNGDPLTDGYSNYGSLGQYQVRVSAAMTPPATPVMSIIPPAVVAEGSTGITRVAFAVELSSAAASPVTVNYATRNGTATVQDGDYRSASGTLTFNVGETRKTVTVEVVGDQKYEATETFSLDLSGPTNAVLGRDSAMATITNDDRYVPPSIFASVYVGNPVTSEGGTVSFTIELSEPVSAASQVGYRTVSRTAMAGQDFGAVTGFVTFLAGETSKTIAVNTIDDTRSESDESFALELIKRPGVIQLSATRSAVATIAFNDGGQPRLSAFAAWSTAMAAPTVLSPQSLPRRDIRSAFRP